MEIDLAVLADYASVTREGKLVIGGIFDRIVAPELPWRQPTMSLVFRVATHLGEPREHTVRVQCVDPDGVEVMPSITQRMVAPDDPVVADTAANFIAALNGVVFAKPGPHRFEIFIDDRNVRSVSFEVALMPGHSDAGQPPQ